jgi:hypothetical protein
MNKVKRIGSVLLALLIGVLAGGYLFSDTRARSFLALNNCEGSCLQPNELVGLLTSVGIQRFPSLLPGVVKETAKVIVMEHPSPHARLHYLVIPKQDVKNIGELSDADREYLFESFAVMSEIIKEKNLVDYQIITNGPGYQGVTYLHFHFIAR